MPAKLQVRSAEVAAEQYAVENNGSYAGLSPEIMARAQPGLTSDAGVVLSVRSAADGYALASEATASHEVFEIVRRATGGVEQRCSPPDRGECPADGEW